MTSGNRNKQVISTFNFGYPPLTLKEGPKVKSVHIKRFPAPDFLHDGFTLQTCKTKKKQFITTFRFCYRHLTLKEGPKVKSDHTKRFPAIDFLLVGLPSQTSRTNNKRVISTFRFDYPRLTLKEGSKVNLTKPKDSQSMISYMLVYHPKSLGPIINEL